MIRCYDGGVGTHISLEESGIISRCLGSVRAWLSIAIVYHVEHFTEIGVTLASREFRNDKREMKLNAIM